MSITPINRLNNVPEYIPAKSKEQAEKELGRSVIKLAANESRFGASPRVRELLSSLTVEDLSLYPEVGSVLFRNEIAKFHGLRDDEIIHGNGSFELIQLIAMTYLDEGDEVIMSQPSFGWYGGASVRSGAEVIKVPLRDFKTDLDAYEKAVTDRTKIIWICNPNNPTGTILSHAEITDFLKRIPENIAVVIDEAYIDYSTEPESAVIDEIRNYQNLIVLRTFSKIYGLAALRIGYAAADPEIIKAIAGTKQPFNVGRQSQAAAVAALNDRDHIRFVHDETVKGLNEYYRAFESWGLEYIPSHGNFVFVNIKRDSKPVVAQIESRGVMIRGGAGYGYPEWLRITVGTEDDNRLLIGILDEVLNS